jgi:hypothetical protein
MTDMRHCKLLNNDIWGFHGGENVKAICSSKTSVTTYKIARRHKPEDHNPRLYNPLWLFCRGSTLSVPQI